MELHDTLLTIHIVTGSVSLAAALVATLTKVLEWPHRLHVYSGRVFFWGMVGVFLTAVPLAILRPNLFLGLIAILSFYFAASGLRYATNRRGSPRPLDWLPVGVMAVAAAVMILFGATLLARRNSNGITMIVLGGIGAWLSLTDLRTLRRGGARGPERIAQHLTMMLSGTIATITAFVVTNVSVKPGFLAWLAPTAVITPIIVVWSRRVRQGKVPRDIPESL